MISIEDLEQYSLLLDNNYTTDKYIIQILKILEKWEPIKNHVIDTNIGKSVFKLSKKSGEIGIRSLNIVNRWKSKLMNSNNENSFQSVKQKNKIACDNITPMVNICKRARETTKDTVPIKKCLSLTEYYKRNPLICPDDKRDDASGNYNNTQSGVSFLDSITIKPISKKKKSKLLSMAELNASISNRVISERKDNVRSQSSTSNVQVTDIEELYVKAPCMPVMYNPKQRYLHSSEAIDHKYFDRSIRNPPSLLSQCQTILFTYKEHIEEVLWTPRELLVHVLKAFNADQLLNFESFNTQFIDEDDDLWEIHFRHKYKTYKDLNFDSSWRNMYLQMDLIQEAKMQRSIDTMRSRIVTNKNEDKKRQIKVLASPRINPNARRNFYRSQTDPVYSLVSKRLRKEYKQLFQHLR